MEPKVIMFDSPEAAELKTVTGWVSADGLFFGKDERPARYSGCTHRSCENCVNIVEKGRIRCRSCEEVRRAEKWAKLPIEKYDGETPLCIFDGDEFFFDSGAVMDHVHEEHSDGREIRLAKCKPGYLHQLDYDNWCDDLPEDGELPDAVATAMESLNEAIKAAGPVCWWEDAIAIDAEDLIARLNSMPVTN